MLASQQINTVKPPDKKPGISEGHLFCVGVALKFNSFGRNCYSIPLAGLLQKHIGLRDSSAKCKNPWCVCARYALWTPYGSIMKAYVL